VLWQRIPTKQNKEPRDFIPFINIAANSPLEYVASSIKVNRAARRPSIARPPPRLALDGL
jgi:hypothetical protein